MSEGKSGENSLLSLPCFLVDGLQEVSPPLGDKYSIRRKQMWTVREVEGKSRAGQ